MSGANRIIRDSHTTAWALGKMSVALLGCLGLTSMLMGCDAETTLHGRYYWGAEVNVVCPCGTDLCYWVRAEPGLLQPLKNFVQRNSSRPYQPVYLSYRGRILDEPAVGFGASYDGLKQIVEVLSMSVELPEDCPEPAQG